MKQRLKKRKRIIECVRKILAAAVADAQVDYNDAKSEYELNCLKAEVDYKTQLINAGYAEKLYKQSSAKVNDNISSIQQEITQREGKVDSLQEAVTEATEKYNEAYKAYEEAKICLEGVETGHSSFLTVQKAYLQAQTTYNNALTSLENAQNSLSDNAQQIRDLKTQLASANASKELDSISVKQEYEESVQSGDNAYLVYKASLESLEETLKEAEDSLKEREKQQEAFEDLVGEDGIVYAPKEGKLVSVGVSVGDELTKEKTMVSYVCADALSISVNVTEEDVVSLSIGESVDIVFTAYPDETFEGIITSIDTTATSSNTKTVSYPVVIRINGDLTRMYGGMTANVSFHIASSADTLYVSRKALVEESGSYYVYVKSGINEYEKKKVTIGLKNTSCVEILSGLEENDTIYIASAGV